jgi:hypothetical protein
MTRWLVWAALALLCSSPQALEFRHGTDPLPAETLINDDVLVAGDDFTCAGRVGGDLLVAGNKVSITGPVAGNLLVLAGDVTLNAPVNGNVIVIGGDVTLMGPVGGSVYGVGGEVSAESTIGRNLALAGGTLTVATDARVARDAALAGGTVEVAGAIGRDLRAQAEALTLTSTARIAGNLSGTANATTVAYDAQIGGKDRISRTRRTAAADDTLAFTLIMGVCFFVAGLPLVLLAPTLCRESVTMLRAHPWGSLLTGLIVCSALPMAFFLLLITIVGIPLAVITLSLMTIALFYTPVLIALALSSLLWPLHRVGVIARTAMGLIVLTLLMLIPHLNTIVGLLTALLGLGALILTLLARTNARIFPVPPLPATEEVVSTAAAPDATATRPDDPASPATSPPEPRETTLPSALDAPDPAPPAAPSPAPEESTPCPAPVAPAVLPPPPEEAPDRDSTDKVG